MSNPNNVKYTFFAFLKFTIIYDEITLNQERSMIDFVNNINIYVRRTLDFSKNKFYPTPLPRGGGDVTILADQPLR